MSKRKKIEIDATNQIVGRLATKVAMALMGKNSPNFTPHIDSGDKVVIFNVENIRFTGRKMESKEFRHHSMHPGGLKIKVAKNLIKKNPKEILLHAISKMLPKNKLRDGRLRRLSFKK